MPGVFVLDDLPDHHQRRAEERDGLNGGSYMDESYEAPIWTQHRIASTNQHPESMAAK